MSQHNYMQLYIHIVWSTWDRLPLISPAIEPRLYRAIEAKCVVLGCQPLALGGVADHMHLLVSFTPTISISRLVGEIKGVSSHLMTHEVQPGKFFRWQRSYGAFTVSHTVLSQLRSYILNQKSHHKYDSTLPEFEPFHQAA
ncbi:MAG: IS200/IS605 family transposase [Chloroflexaceae bacterium]